MVQKQLVNAKKKFVTRSSGIYLKGPNGTGPVHLASKLEITGHHRYEGSNSQFIAYSFIDQSGHKMKGEIFRGDLLNPRTVLTHLVGSGWSAPGFVSQPKLLADYLEQSVPSEVVTLTPTISWRGTHFVWPNKKVTFRDQTFKFRASRNAHPVDLRCAGTIAQWQARVFTPAMHSRALVFAICVALAALARRRFTSISGGGFHLYGGSSRGKTTTLLVAHSVVGKPRRTGLFTWDVTDTGLEETATQHSDLLLCLDDTSVLTGQSDKDLALKVQDVSYRLGGRMGRTRSKQFRPQTQELGAVPVSAPDVLYLSTGERSIAQISLAGGVSRLAGSEVRLVDIPIGRMDSAWGIFDSLGARYASLQVPEQEKSRRMAHAIRRDCARFHGVAGRHFTAYLSKFPKGARRAFDQHLKEFQALPTGHDGVTQQRIKERFALIYAAGMVAVQAKTLPNRPEAISDAVMWGYRAAMSDVGKPTTSLPDDIETLKVHLRKIQAAESVSTDEMLEKFGGFTAADSRYAGCVLLKNEALSNLLEAKTRVTRLLTVLNKKGCLMGNAKEGKARSIVYRVGRTRMRMFAINIARLEAL